MRNQSGKRKRIDQHFVMFWTAVIHPPPDTGGGSGPAS
jgi:hypothetical protein